MTGPIPRVAVIDYGLGNVGSVRNMFRRIGVLAEPVSSPDHLDSFSHAVLPGIGHFARGMELLRGLGWDDAVNRFALEQARPLLGVCLGMQLLARRSDEGDQAGLGLIDTNVVYFDRAAMDRPRTVPHMGWADVRPAGQSKLLPQQTDLSRFYFVHSLHVDLQPDSPIASGVANHGYDFVCAFERDNVFGVQFHPEKSHRFGMDLLRRFADYRC